MIAHGGGLIAARHRFPAAPEPWIDLSTGINPVPYPVPQIPQAALTRLPEPEEVAALEMLAARAYGVADPACVAAGPGTQALIHLLPRLIAPGRVAVVGWTYAEHRAAWMLAGHDVTSAPSVAETGGAGVVVLVRPNNPDGAVASAAVLLDLAASLATRGGLLVVDEAFADLEACSLAASLPHPGLLLLRSFGKTYGLAGVRLGFALAERHWAALLRQSLGPWAVSGPALYAGQFALADTLWREAAADRLARDAHRLDTMLAGVGCHMAGGTKLFRLYEHNEAGRLADRMGEAGILVRRFADHPAMLRFGIPGDPAAWSRLAAALG